MRIPQKRVVRRVNGKRVQLSHIVWFKHYGEWPKGYIDHIDRNPLNNDITNLRLCTWQQNNFNRKAWNNSSGEKNVVFAKHCNKWQVKIKAGALVIHQIASHKLSAILAARLIRRELHGEFAYQEAA